MDYLFSLAVCWRCRITSPDPSPSPPGIYPPSEPPTAGGTALSTTSTRRRRDPLPSVCMLLQQYSLDHKSGHAHRGRGACIAWLFADGSATRRKPALSFHPPCVSMVKTWLEPLRHATFLPLRHTTFLPVQPGGVPVTVSPLLTPPLLRLGSVGVLTSVPVALVIKRAGYTHTR